jgi:5-methylcytosine-specific restriction endonuclease McrA
MTQDFCWFCSRRKDLLASLKPQTRLEVHHIVPVSDGGSDEPHNLILLCAECHAEAHRRREAFDRYRSLINGGAAE